MALYNVTSAISWSMGKYRELKDSIENFDNFMTMIKKFYSEYTKISEHELDGILEHDLFLVEK